MRDFRDAKAMAKTLREALSAKPIAVTISESQELVARVLGFRDWNVLAAKIQSTEMTTTSAQANTPISGEANFFPSHAGHGPVPAHDFANFRCAR